MFVKFECGCIAFSTPAKDGRFLMIEACDDDLFPAVVFRKTDTNNHQELNADEEHALLRRVRETSKAARDLAKLKALLK